MDARTIGAASAVAFATLCAGSLAASEDDGFDSLLDNRVRARLVSFQEVPSIVSPGRGLFRAEYDEANDEVRWTLRYEGLEGKVTQAHIHVAQRGVNGGISVWLCSNLASPPTPAGIQPCPQSGEISGTISSDDIVGPAAQGVEPREGNALLAAVRAGVTYANVHSDKYPGGEIRGQLAFY